MDAVDQCSAALVIGLDALATVADRIAVAQTIADAIHVGRRRSASVRAGLFGSERLSIDVARCASAVQSGVDADTLVAAQHSSDARINRRFARSGRFCAQSDAHRCVCQRAVDQ